MVTSECHILLWELIEHFEAVAIQMDQGIQRLANEGCPTSDLAPFRRCRDAARRGAILATSAMSDVDRRFPQSGTSVHRTQES